MQQQLFDDAADGSADRDAAQDADPAGANRSGAATSSRDDLVSGFEARLARSAANYDVTAAMVHYAAELVAMQDGLEPAERQAVLVVVVATIIEQRRGSTRLPLLEAGPDRQADGRGLIGALLGGTDTPKPGPDAANMAYETMSAASEAGGPVGSVLAGSVLAGSLVGNSQAPKSGPDTANMAYETMLARAERQVVAMVSDLVDAGAVSTIIGEPGQYRPLIFEGGNLYHQRMLYAENRLVEAVGRRLAMDDAQLDAGRVARALKALEATMPVVADGRPMQLNPEQKYALVAAAYRPMTIISGGPGTGKTAIVVSLLRLVARLGVGVDQVALAAPTGKAAHRLGESIAGQLRAIDGADPVDRRLAEQAYQPQTLHRLLGYSAARRQVYHHQNNPLSAQIVVVDEASMVDLMMMERLICAVADGAQLVLLGDAQQLPSVEAGAVFRDLVPDHIDTDPSWLKLLETPPPASACDEPTAGHAVRLHTSYRMDPTDPAGSQILDAARRLNQGEPPAAGPADTGVGRPAGFAEIDGRGVEVIDPARRDSADMNSANNDSADMNSANNDSAGPMADFVRWWYDQRIRADAAVWARLGQPFVYAEHGFDEPTKTDLRAVFDHFASIQALSLTRVFDTGADALNARFHARHLRAIRSESRPELVVGEPVVMLQNDYARGLFNGDQGVVLTVDRGDQQAADMVVFRRRGRFVPFNLGPLRAHLEHSFVLTVHKAQGSEFDAVAVVLPGENIPLLTREIVYTAMTRSRRSVVFVGDAARLRTAAAHPVRRYSGIGAKLKGSP